MLVSEQSISRSPCGDPPQGDLLTGYNGKTVTNAISDNMLLNSIWIYTREHSREPMTIDEHNR